MFFAANVKYCGIIELMLVDISPFMVMEVVVGIAELYISILWVNLFQLLTDFAWKQTLLFVATVDFVLIIRLFLTLLLTHFKRTKFFAKMLLIAAMFSIMIKDVLARITAVDIVFTQHVTFVILAEMNALVSSEVDATHICVFLTFVRAFMVSLTVATV